VATGARHRCRRRAAYTARVRHPRLPLVPLVVALAAPAGCARPVATTAVAPASVAPAPAPAAPLTRFEAEVRAFEAADRAAPPAPGGVVFVGSSTFRLWPALAADFPGVPVVNRGFGGSTLPEVLHYAPRLVLPHRPRLVVLYAGDNDLADGRTPAQVAADYEAFVALLRRALPAVRVAFVSIKPSPSRWALADRARAANAAVRAATARDTAQRYVDVFTPMLGADGRPRPELFGPDGLHMTPAGYALWRERLAAVVR
jgi:lysophospholipase L1-like esterase